MKNSIGWESQPPAGCPFPPSPVIPGCRLTGRYANYTDADTWYPSWGEDDRLYSPFTDTIGNGVNGVMSRSGGGAQAVVGHATILGADPLRLEIVAPGTIPGPGGRYKGRYPSASLHHDGIWYLGTFGLSYDSPQPAGQLVGPFGGFHISRDNGKTWTSSPLSTEIGEALFPEPANYLMEDIRLNADAGTPRGSRYAMCLQEVEIARPSGGAGR